MEELHSIILMENIMKKCVKVGGGGGGGGKEKKERIGDERRKEFSIKCIIKYLVDFFL